MRLPALDDLADEAEPSCAADERQPPPTKAGSLISESSRWQEDPTDMEDEYGFDARAEATFAEVIPAPDTRDERARDFHRELDAQAAARRGSSFGLVIARLRSVVFTRSTSSETVQKSQTSRRPADIQKLKRRRGVPRDSSRVRNHST